MNTSRSRFFLWFKNLFVPIADFLSSGHFGGTKQRKNCFTFSKSVSHLFWISGKISWGARKMLPRCSGGIVRKVCGIFYLGLEEVFIQVENLWTLFIPTVRETCANLLSDSGSRIWTRCGPLWRSDHPNCCHCSIFWMVPDTVVIWLVVSDEWIQL